MSHLSSNLPENQSGAAAASRGVACRRRVELARSMGPGLGSRALRYRFPAPLLFAFLFALAGCTPSIGDKCTLSTDCSLRGDRLCDTSQPGGYCTVFNCTPNACPSNSGCVLFHPNVQGCSLDDRSPSRTARTFCIANCQSDSDCRTADGYICADPRGAPWGAMILDNDQGERFCIPPPDQKNSSSVDASTTSAPVCQPAAPPVPPILIDASAPTDAGTDAPPDAPNDAADGGIADAADAGG